MIEVSTSIEIARTADEVFDFVAEVQNNPRWQRGQRSCEWTSGPPVRVGSTYDQRARFLGKDIVNSFRVMEHEPGRSVRFTSTGGSFPITITRTVEPLGASRSRFTEHVVGDSKGFYRIAAAVEAARAGLDQAGLPAAQGALGALIPDSVLRTQ